MPNTYTMITPEGKEFQADHDQIEILKKSGNKLKSSVIANVQGSEDSQELAAAKELLSSCTEKFAETVKVFNSIDESKKKEKKEAHDVAEAAKAEMDKAAETLAKLS